MVLWCISLLKHGDEQSAVWRPRSVLQSAVDPDHPVLIVVETGVPSSSQSGPDVVKRRRIFYFVSVSCNTPSRRRAARVSE